MSVFRPVDTQLYQVVYWYPEQPETPIIVKTPSPNVYRKSPIRSDTPFC